ncbi:GNAT family N-acetyltransferase [Citricoccus sp. SGAir0253]|uniref:GNAT family N-acetyltransferase n=1 Tax=Citricoccus sp. SGAir0253 TaxID=2567881 RepID=UPI0010CCEC5D|nr:GNAT family N-acetyltransferase [Citricoccus sp. SGAir0253]QCU77185.1 GNAT family N-acetyltransferase [Citricoccus sp. SGAir0253]
MTITRATPAHAATVGRLLHDFNVEFDSPTPTAEEFAARFTRLLEWEDQLVLLAGDPADPEGFAYLTTRSSPYYDGPLMQLEELYVRPRLRDRGIGTELVLGMLRRARERHCGEIHVNVDEVDVDTRRFYERHGFTNTEPGEDSRMLLYLREL